MEYNQDDINSNCMSTKWVEYAGNQSFASSPAWVQVVASHAFYTEGNTQMIFSVQVGGITDVPAGYTEYDCEDGKALFAGDNPKYNGLIRGKR